MSSILIPTMNLLIGFVLVSANAAFAREWRGIVPLHSMRSDVERLLGPPTRSSSSALYYTLQHEIAVISLQSSSCDSHVGKFGIGWNVPLGTVTEIGVIPKRSRRKEPYVVGNDFNFERANAGFEYYSNEREGLNVEVYNGLATNVTYLPEGRERILRCRKTQECCIDFFPRFDEFKDLSLEEERARFDNWAITMREDFSRGVVVVYGKSRELRIKSMKRIERTKHYLAQQRGIEPNMFLIVDGGYSEDSKTELRLYPVASEINHIYLFPQNDPK